MTGYIDLALAILAAANLLGVSGLYYRLGAAMQTHEHIYKRLDQLHADHARLSGRMTTVERNQTCAIGG